MNRDETLLAFNAAGLQRVRTDMESLVENSIRLASRLVSTALPVGASRLGGQPDLPDGEAWPLLGDAPMSFVGQIRLEDVAPFDSNGWLPKTGLLSFFYDQNQETYGASPSDCGGWKVLYLSGGPASLRPRPFPDSLAQEARFKVCALTPASEATLPGSPAQHLPDLQWSPDEVHRYEDLLANYPSAQDHTELHHRMFGHPEQIQDDMQLQSALYANNLEDPDDPAAAPFLARKADWKLLLQIDSDYNAGMRWASSGRLYFWIELQALKALAFDRTWVVLQSE